MPYFYYVRSVSLNTLSPRKSEQWPPIGNEVNPVVWKTEISIDEAKRKLSALELKYRKKAEADLTQ